ncbi:MAG: SEL1-like repeat protein [Planctomycetes bacterium]|nr:SEL1-like repeat protein [Planctomycetota bacterium]
MHASRAMDPTARGSRWNPRVPVVPLLASATLFAFLVCKPIAANERLQWTFAGVATLVGAWALALWLRGRAHGRVFAIEPNVVRAHYVQALVQFTIYAYWSRSSPGVITEAPLIVAQVVYLYALDALMSWSRGRPFRLGYGALPIIFSTNLLLWFRPDYYYFQFAMVTVGALGKQWLTWTRDGRRTHIFNPSVFGQSVVALVLIATGATTKYTMGEEIAVSFESLDHIWTLLFLLGLVVQGLFQVTLMTLAGVSTLALLNLAYTGMTGSYWFVTLNIGATVFLGMHLLMTDPSTSPRTNVGRVMFGSLYAVGYFMLFRVFDDHAVPVFWDKLLPVPILNLCVPLFDRLARSGAVGRLNQAWERALAPHASNAVHMTVWAAVAGTMLWTGFIQGPHPGKSLGFWVRAAEEGRPRAAQNLLLLANYRAQFESAEANEILGRVYHEGKYVRQDDKVAAAYFVRACQLGAGSACAVLGRWHLEGHAVVRNPSIAAQYFAKACELGSTAGCEGVVGQYLFLGQRVSQDIVVAALDKLETMHQAEESGQCRVLLACAYERGAGRPQDPARALALFEAGCAKGNTQCCTEVARLRETVSPPPAK